MSFKSNAPEARIANAEAITVTVMQLIDLCIVEQGFACDARSVPDVIYWAKREDMFEAFLRDFARRTQS